MVPTVAPETTPVVDAVATAELLLLQTPPGEESLNVVVDPGHTEVVPAIGGPATTVSTMPTEQVPTV